MIIVLRLLPKYLCGERIRDLSLRPGNWRKDILVGIGLMVLSLGTFMLLREPIYSAFPSAPSGGVGGFFDELVRSPMPFALIIGPGLIIGAGVFEELTRVFLPTRPWNILVIHQKITNNELPSGIAKNQPRRICLDRPNI